MGTALLGRGLPAGVCPERWLEERPEEVARVHAAHAAAGAGLVLTCTFNLGSDRWEGSGEPARVERLAKLAVRIARDAAPGRLVAGALGPDTPHPRPAQLEGRGAPHPRPAQRGEGRGEGPGHPVPHPSTLALRALAAAGADLLWLETQLDLPGALGALAAARATGLPAVVTFLHPEREHLLAVARAGALAVGVNCLPADPALGELARWARADLPVPFVARPSPGPPGAVAAPGAFARALAPALEAGALLGGCCGAGAEHLAALAQLLATLAPG
jgi:5-methyltetrahydrofolate--homocysteine methyltransferase